MPNATKEAKDVRAAESKQLAAARAAEEQSTAELMAYYKSRLEGFEAERAELLSRLDQCAVQGAELHVLEWEARKRAEEVRDLQKALSDAHNFLFDERQRLLALQAENDDLRLQEIQDRKTIQQLLAGGPHAAQGPRQQPGQQGRGAAAAASSSAVPGPSTDHLLLQIESLHAQLNEQKQLAAERIAALQEDRRIREQEEEAHRRALTQQLEVATERLQRLEQQLRTTTKDYILGRRERQAAEERALECQAALARERQSFLEQSADLRRRAAAELSATKQEAENKVEDLTNNLRAQLKTREEELVNLSSVHTTAVAQYDRRVSELELKVARLSESNRQLELRRHLDCEGWTADVSALRKTLTAVDRKLHEMRLVERLEDDDRLDAILKHLRKKAPKVPLPCPPGSGAASGPGLSGGETQSVKSALAEGLQDVRSRVKDLELRLADKQQQMQQHQQQQQQRGVKPGANGGVARAASATKSRR
ncbi:centriole protein [Volvox carteri f. nagariensis]|uniref:Centriole protein n=1 Tax=Volvox carteri f. nagariensis TaxID=3068 RepID=D8UAL4_VOLCA|nr:centriole protein [Volvox carteri f. nagariensis]EFJ43281.1 centriole protein [Volvox carteri f. nagariensis]|eukprot:XP_002955641.1 centriole protein [Volvox carteri f. nagariensis]